MNTLALSAATRLKKLRESYIRQLPSQMEKIRTACDALDKECPGQPEIKELHRYIHTMKGSSASVA